MFSLISSNHRIYTVTLRSDFTLVSLLTKLSKPVVLYDATKWRCATKSFLLKDIFSFIHESLVLVRLVTLNRYSDIVFLKSNFITV